MTKCCALLFVFLVQLVVTASFKPPKYFFVFGEHRSGASYLSELIRQNVSPFDLQDCYLLNSKHDEDSHAHHKIYSAHRRPDTHDLPSLEPSKPTTFPRYQRVTRSSLKLMQCPVEETLFIFITKNPFSWLVSMAERQFKRSVSRVDVKAFAEQKWAEKETKEKWRSECDFFFFFLSLALQAHTHARGCVR